MMINENPTQSSYTQLTNHSAVDKEVRQQLGYNSWLDRIQWLNHLRAKLDNTFIRVS